MWLALCSSCLQCGYYYCQSLFSVPTYTDGNTLHLLTKLNPPINDILNNFRQLRANHFDWKAINIFHSICMISIPIRTIILLFYIEQTLPLFLQSWYAFLHSAEVWLLQMSSSCAGYFRSSFEPTRLLGSLSNVPKRSVSLQDRHISWHLTISSDIELRVDGLAQWTTRRILWGLGIVWGM